MYIWKRYVLKFWINSKVSIRYLVRRYYVHYIQSKKTFLVAVIYRNEYYNSNYFTVVLFQSANCKYYNFIKFLSTYFCMPTHIHNTVYMCNILENWLVYRCTDLQKIVRYTRLNTKNQITRKMIMLCNQQKQEVQATLSA